MGDVQEAKGADLVVVEVVVVVGVGVGALPHV